MFDDIDLEDDAPLIAADSVLMAFDRSMRSIDSDGHLHVKDCNISKANVCPYYGSEIPNAAELGLDPAAVYMLYRDAAELEAAVPTFENKPLMMKHVAVNANDPQKWFVCGTVSNVRWRAPYVVADIAVWDGEAIKLIESHEQEQLSSAYRYKADMTAKTVDGVHADGSMRSIGANHVALVVEGRVGPDVFVNDSIPQGFIDMKRSALLAALAPFMKADADMIAADSAIVTAFAADAKAAADKKAADKKAKDEAEEKAKKEAEDKAAKDGEMDDTDAEDENMDPLDGTPPKEGVRGKDKAMDAASVDKIVAAKIAANNALHTARREVETIIGVVAYDSAGQVYKAALDKLGVATDGVHESAYPALLKIAKDAAAQRATAPVAMDAAATADMMKAFPGLARIN